MIYVCSLEEMPRHAADLRPALLVSLVPEPEQPPTPAGIPAEAHLRLAIDDVADARPGVVCPGEEHVSVLIEALRDRPRDEPVLLHCFAGISRSTAAALVALAIDAHGREAEAAAHLRRFAPHALPNTRIVALADGLLQREGRLIAARDAMGPAEVLTIAPLVRIPPLD